MNDNHDLTGGSVTEIEVEISLPRVSDLEQMSYDEFWSDACWSDPSGSW